MRMAYDAEDWSSLGDYAHWLKGSGGSVGFGQLHTPAIELEVAARAADSATASACLAELEAPVLRFRSSSLHSNLDTPTDESPITNEGTPLSNIGYLADTLITSTLLDQNPRFYPIVEQFIERLTVQMSSLEKAFEEDDPDAIVDLAHWLRGSGGNVEYEEFVDLSQALENSARMNDRFNIRLGIDLIRHFAVRVLRGWDDAQLTSKSA